MYFCFSWKRKQVINSNSVNAQHNKKVSRFYDILLAIQSSYLKHDLIWKNSKMQPSFIKIKKYLSPQSLHKLMFNFNPSHQSPVLLIFWKDERCDESGTFSSSIQSLNIIEFKFINRLLKPFSEPKSHWWEYCGNKGNKQVWNCKINFNTINFLQFLVFLLKLLFHKFLIYFLFCKISPRLFYLFWNIWGVNSMFFQKQLKF